jgi:hypothetical protein
VKTTGLITNIRATTAEEYFIYLAKNREMRGVRELVSTLSTPQ